MFTSSKHWAGTHLVLQAVMAHMPQERNVGTHKEKSFQAEKLIEFLPHKFKRLNFLRQWNEKDDLKSWGTLQPAFCVLCGNSSGVQALSCFPLSAPDLSDDDVIAECPELLSHSHRKALCIPLEN